MYRSALLLVTLALLCSGILAADKAEAKCSCSEADLEAKSTEISTLESQLVSLNKESETLNSKITQLESALSDAKKEAAAAQGASTEALELSERTKKALATAESAKTKCTGELQTAKDSGAGETAQLKADLAEAKATLSASDVQAMLAVRKSAMEGAAVVGEYSNVALEKASQGLTEASDAYEVYSKQAVEEATRLYEKALPVVEETQKKCLETVTPHYDAALAASQPHIATAKEHFQFSLSWLKGKLETGLNEASVHVPQIKPHVPVAAKAGAHLILLAPIALLGLMIFFAVIRRISLLLLKLEYCALFILLGMVAAVAAISLATKEDPIAQLRAKAPESYESFHNAMAVLGLTLGVTQFSILLSKAETGKGRVGLLLSLVAAGMNALLFGHYYNMVYKKAQADPAFTMSFPIKGDGSASYAEYSIFVAIVVLVSAASTPKGFCFSSRAILMSLEGVITGFCYGLLLLAHATTDPLGKITAMKEAPIAIAAVFGLLLLVLVSRVLARLFGIAKDYSLLVSILHLCYVAYATFKVGELPYKNYISGSSTPLATTEISKCGKLFLGLLVLQVLRTAYVVTTPAVTSKSNVKKPAQTPQTGKKGKKN